MLFVTLLIHLLALFECASSAITFLSEPQNVDVLYGEVATFDCSGKGYDLFWSYGGGEVTSELEMTKNITVVSDNY